MNLWNIPWSFHHLWYKRAKSGVVQISKSRNKFVKESCSLLVLLGGCKFLQFLKIFQNSISLTGKFGICNFQGKSFLFQFIYQWKNGILYIFIKDLCSFLPFAIHSIININTVDGFIPQLMKFNSWIFCKNNGMEFKYNSLQSRIMIFIRIKFLKISWKHFLDTFCISKVCFSNF